MKPVERSLTLSMKETKRLLRVLISSFSWIRTACKSGSSWSSTGVRRLVLTDTGLMGTAAGRLLKLLLEELMMDRQRERDEEVCYRGMTGRQVVLPENSATYTLTGGCVFLHKWEYISIPHSEKPVQPTSRPEQTLHIHARSRRTTIHGYVKRSTFDYENISCSWLSEICDECKVLLLHVLLNFVWFLVAYCSCTKK